MMDPSKDYYEQRLAAHAHQAWAAAAAYHNPAAWPAVTEKTTSNGETSKYQNLPLQDLVFFLIISLASGIGQK